MSFPEPPSDRSAGRIEHLRFKDIGGYLRAGDLLVVNDTRVVPARLRGRKETGGQAELLVLDPYQDNEAAAVQGYQCLVKTAKRAAQKTEKKAKRQTLNVEA